MHLSLLAYSITRIIFYLKDKAINGINMHIKVVMSPGSCTIYGFKHNVPGRVLRIFHIIKANRVKPHQHFTGIIKKLFHGRVGCINCRFFLGAFLAFQRKYSHRVGSGCYRCHDQDSQQSTKRSFSLHLNFSHPFNTFLRITHCLQA